MLSVLEPVDVGKPDLAFGRSNPSQMRMEMSPETEASIHPGLQDNSMNTSHPPVLIVLWLRELG